MYKQAWGCFINRFIIKFFTIIIILVIVTTKRKMVHNDFSNELTTCLPSSQSIGLMLSNNMNSLRKSWKTNFKFKFKEFGAKTICSTFLKNAHGSKNLSYINIGNRQSSYFTLSFNQQILNITSFAKLLKLTLMISFNILT